MVDDAIVVGENQPITAPRPSGEDPLTSAEKSPPRRMAAPRLFRHDHPTVLAFAALTAIGGAASGSLIADIPFTVNPSVLIARRWSNPLPDLAQPQWPTR